MKVRFISALVALPLLIIPLILGGTVLTVLAVLISLLGIYEFYHAFGIKDKKLYGIGATFTVLYYLLIYFDRLDYFMPLLGILVMVCLATFVIFYDKSNLMNIVCVPMGFIYVPYLISHVVLVRNHETMGMVAVWLVFLTAFGSDTFAYFFGRAFGKHKLAATLSPNKTIEGSIGGLFGAVVFNLVYLAILYCVGYEVDGHWVLRFVLIGLFGSVLAQIGDLAASGMKRYTKIKDFGHIMPGHGGVLDRLDSVLFTAPLVFYILMFL